MTAPRIGYVLGTTSGGTGRHAAMLADACLREGCGVLAFGPADTRSLFSAGVVFEPVEIADRPRPVRDAVAIRRLRRLLKRAQLDVVHAHGLRAGALAALALGAWPPARRSDRSVRDSEQPASGSKPPDRPSEPSAYGSEPPGHGAGPSDRGSEWSACGSEPPGLGAEPPVRGSELSGHGAGRSARGLGRSGGGRVRYGPALLVTVHNAPPVAARAAAIYALLERLVARRADAVLCVSSDLSARMRRVGAEDVALAVVPAPALAEPAAPAELGAAGRPVVLAAGRLTGQKGFDTLLAAAVHWRDRQPQPLLVIAGDGPLAGELTGLARELGVTARFLGDRDDVPALLAAADVFVLPSRWEGQPLILQEALRAARPTVAADVGGVSYLTGPDAALLVPPEDPAALAEAVLRVLDDQDLAARLAAAALARAARLPSDVDAAQAALAVYRRLAPSSARSTAS